MAVGVCKLHRQKTILIVDIKMRQPVVLKSNTSLVETAYPAAFAWLGLVAVYLGFLSVGFVFHFLPPILPVIIADLQLSHTEAGLLMSLFA